MEQKLQPQAPTQPKQTPQHPPKQNHEKSPPNTTITKSNNNSNGNSNSNNNDNNIVNNSNKVMNNKKAIWDCGSTLYDSFELNSLQKQLDSAIINSTRTMSMPRLPSQDHRAQPQPQPPPPPPSKKSKFSRSFQKLIRSIFRAPKLNNNDARPNYDSSSPDPWFLDQKQDKNNMKVVDSGRYFVVFEKPNGLSTIPEVPEVGFSPEIRSLVRKTMSDRFSFTPPITSDGIYCV